MRLKQPELRVQERSSFFDQVNRRVSSLAFNWKRRDDVCRLNENPLVYIPVCLNIETRHEPVEAKIYFFILKNQLI